MKYEIAIIGGGVVGCAILNKLVSIGHTSCVLLEKGFDVATGASKANSGLVHAGFDCQSGTLKAKMNVRGNAMFPSLAKRLSVPYRQVGAMVVGNDPVVVKQLYHRGLVNGVHGMKILSRTAILKKNPHIADDITCALYAKTAGIISPYVLTVALAEEAVLNGGTVLLDFPVTKVKRLKQGYQMFSGKQSVEAQVVINAAGMGYNEVADLLKSEHYEINLVRGEYYVLDAKTSSFCQLTIFPLPTDKGKGVLITPTIDGNLLVGPTADAGETTITTKTGLATITEKVNCMMKDVPLSATIRQFAGIRTNGNDFIIEKSKLMPNVINLACISSPGLSSAPAIAEYVACDLLGFKNKTICLKRRKPIVPIKGQSVQKQQKMIRKDATYGEIVCKCELVSKKEVLDALHSPLAPKTFDALKRRVRVGMGACQSGFCLLKTIELIEKESGRSFLTAQKENEGSYLFAGKIEKKVNFTIAGLPEKQNRASKKMKDLPKTKSQTRGDKSPKDGVHCSTKTGISQMTAKAETIQNMTKTKTNSHKIV